MFCSPIYPKWAQHFKIILIIWLAAAFAANAASQFKVSVKKIQGNEWHLDNLRLEMQNGAKTVLSAAQVRLPPPMDQLELFEMSCLNFKILDRQLQCQNGAVKLRLGEVDGQSAHLGFTIRVGQSDFQLSDLRFAHGRIDLTGHYQAGRWQLKLAAEQLSLAQLQKLFKTSAFSLKSGQINLNLTLDGKATSPEILKLALKTQDASGQTQEGQYAAERAFLDGTVTLQQQGLKRLWQGQFTLQRGALYIDPWYVEAVPEHKIDLISSGEYLEQPKFWQFKQFQLLHPGVVKLSAQAKWAVDDEKPWRMLNLEAQTQNTQQFFKIYMAPFLVGTAYEGLVMSGKLRTAIHIKDQLPTSIYLNFENLALSDAKQRVNLVGGDGFIDWNSQLSSMHRGYLSWQRMTFFSVPFEATQLNFAIAKEQIALLHPVRMAVLGGQLLIQQFKWQIKSGVAPQFNFSGELHDLSLEQLSTALDWTPLSGKISGVIPGIAFQHDRLDLDGALSVRVFDGEININRLALANVFGDMPQFYSDIKIDRLNLKQLTEKFKFGSIEGLLSGSINNLYLENWQPVSFYAWLGTPDNDATAHRISQKAVDNIASIGGGGATDLISRSVLGIFDSFGYQRLGLGCYLHEGVCQLMGLEAAPNGYYIVKGGGLPKIDVIGYNPRVDWKVLLQRLGRISAPNTMVIE